VAAAHFGRWLARSKRRKQRPSQRLFANPATSEHVVDMGTPTLNDPILDLAELRKRGFEVLVPALSWVNAVRFIQLHDASTSDYVMDRDQFLPAWGVETMIHEIEERQKSP
jgi:hypothetical protein